MEDDRNYATGFRGAVLGTGGQISRDIEQTELTSLLGTCGQQAADIRRMVGAILDRVSPQNKDESCDPQAFNGGHIGRAELLRSTQREVLEALTLLSKLV